MAIVRWRNLNEEILKATKSLESKGFKVPTVRAVYYVLGSMGVIPLTKSGYKSLDAKIVQMRKDEEIPWGFFAVKRGTSIETESYTNPESLFASAEKYVKNLDQYYSVPRWYGQPKYVEIWIEKDGLLGALHNWTEDLGITVRAPQGYGAWEFIHDNINRITSEIEDRAKAYTEDEIEVHILYLGDLDPSGKDIPRFISEGAFEHFGFDATFTELALDLEQVRQYSLPEIPESQEVRAKIARDPRYSKYVQKYGEVFCELDAFFSLATEQAQALIRNSVHELFDESYEETREELETDSKAKLRKLLKDRIVFKGDRSRKD